MPSVNYKTARLARGRHRAPEEGVCVMELASMLAGEGFTDQPSTVSPVIGAFLRAYNDAATEEHRQRLLRFASDALGTRAAASVERERARLCVGWLREVEPAHSGLARRLRLRIAVALRRPSVVASALGRAASHADAGATEPVRLRLVDELIAMSPRPERPVFDRPAERPTPLQASTT